MVDQSARKAPLPRRIPQATNPPPPPGPLPPLPRSWRQW